MGKATRTLGCTHTETEHTSSRDKIVIGVTLNLGDPINAVTDTNLVPYFCQQNVYSTAHCDGRDKETDDFELFHKGKEVKFRCLLTFLPGFVAE